MDQTPSLLTSDTIQMLVKSVTDSGSKPMTGIEAERILNAIARVQAGVPTGMRDTDNTPRA